MLTVVHRDLHLDLSNHVVRNVIRLRMRAHIEKVEAAAWLEDGSRVCDQCMRGACSFILPSKTTSFL
jgi:hypothetical protein